MDIRNLSELELARYISSHLREHNIETVLTGGSATSIYTNGEYTSYDLDFVDMSYSRFTNLERVMGMIGFYNARAKGYFKHDDSPYLVEFLNMPIGVGDEIINPRGTILDNGLRILSPTDCVKDRLSGYFYASNNQADDSRLLQALGLIEYQFKDIKFDEILKWIESEQIKKDGLKEDVISRLQSKWDSFSNQKSS